MKRPARITGLPGFANLPGGVGYFFGQRNNTAQDTELLILITPHKLRLRDRISRSIYVGRDTSGGGGSALTCPGLPSGSLDRNGDVPGSIAFAANLFFFLYGNGSKTTMGW